MRLLRPMQTAIIGSVLSVTLAVAPAFAHDGPESGPAMPLPAYAPPPYPDHPHEMAPDARENWLDDCRARMGRHKDRDARDFCAAYLDDYYAHYRGPQPYGGHYYGSTYAYPGYAGGCCQPMMLVPIVRVPRPDCKETVEYEYVDVPVRAAPPRPVARPVPDKRIRIAPDKRVPVE